MDEEYSESIDTSADMDVSDTDVAEDIPADIPDDVPEDIPEDDYSDSDVADDLSEDVSDDAVTDEAEYNDVEDSIEEDSIEPEAEEMDDSIDDFEEDSYDDSEIPPEDEAETDDIPEDSDEIEETAGSEMTDVEDAPEDTGSSEDVNQDESYEDEIVEDVDDGEVSEETADTEDTEGAEQPEDVTDAELTDDTSAVENTDTTDQPEDVTDAEATDDTSDVENTDTTEKPKDVIDAEATDEATDTEETDTTDQPEDVTDAEATDETADVDDTATAEQSNEMSDAETTDVDNPSEASEINSISDYMNAHNYGSDDFATYSQDPQWRQLMRQEYPDYELPEMTRESANAQLSQYMNDHNYGVDDYAEYSQDPVWRELHSTAFPDDELPPLSGTGGETKGGIFSSINDLNPNPDLDDVKLEDLSQDDYERIKANDPQRASRLLTDYNDRNIPQDDLSELPRQLKIDNNDGLSVIDEELTAEKAVMRDATTGDEYTVYPNPMRRISHMEGMQGQNDLGMHQDCGIASTAKGINDLYGKKVTNENRLADYAFNTDNCSIERNYDGSIDIYNSGGTWEANVKDFYNANGLDADMYVEDSMPSPEALAERLKNGDVATLAVNHDLMWSWDEAMAFQPEMVNEDRYANDLRYAQRVDDLMKMKDGGIFKADHYVNVSNAVYDQNGALTHFIVSDTGNGTTKMIDKNYLFRAYNGIGNIGVSARGCVIAGRRRA